MTRAASTAAGIVAVPGFGASAEVWRDLADPLRPYARLNAVDLPGHGGRPDTGDWSLEALARAFATGLDGAAIWLGWSLGALVAFEAAARFPQRVRAVVAVSMGPRFVTAPDWPNALSADALAQFRSGLEADVDATLRRFYLLQTRTRKGAQPALARRLASLASARGRPLASALAGALDLLAGADLRATCASLRCPVLTILGSDDALVPKAVREDLLRLNSRWQVAVIEGAGHAPFLSHREKFQRCLDDFVSGLTAPAPVTG